ncbi:hypothetical protein OG582_40490 (plasmid) [Streptomyces anulatus]|uniref:hypothetical protein n=1 Tax=Streptomyces anulatus TaxID=1892 RepID=UPI00325202A9
MSATPNLDDEQITALSDTLYNALYAITPYAEPHFADQTEGLKNAVRAVLAEEAAHQWIEKQLEQTGIRAMDFRNGMQMEMEPARELLASWVAAARTMLGDAPNYTETKISMDVKVAESPEMYTLVVQRNAPGVLTPHEARQKAEAKVAELEAQLAEYEVMNPQQCPAGQHPDWLVDSEHTHACPWCRIAQLEDEDSHEAKVAEYLSTPYTDDFTPQAEQPDRIADSEILRAAPDNTDDWSDEAWAAWHRVAERAHAGRNGAPRG